MKKIWLPILFVLLLAACGRASTPAPAQVQPTTAAPTLPPATATPAPTALPSATATVTEVPATATPAASPTPNYPAEGRGPTGFAAGINPLTGLAADPALLNRRPVVIKVENLPRSHRPQWGLNLADLVFEYYTEQGATRFAAVFYGSDAERVGPIRSGRFFDDHIVQMYKAVFVYGSAYPAVQERFFNANYASRLVLETPNSCPALCRYEPNGENLLVSNTAELKAYLASRGINNDQQNLDGMFFKMQPPAGGEDASQLYVRYSGAIYNRWDFDQASGRYLRFSEKQDDVNRTNEVYEQLTDRLTGSPVVAENVVTLCVPHAYFVKREDTEVLDILMSPSGPSYTGCDGKTYAAGTGAAYLARDGKIYPVMWKRPAADEALTLVDANGSPFPFKPGRTWFEVVGASSKVDPKGDGVWRFTHGMVP